MQVGQRNPFGTVTLTGVYLAGQCHAWIVALLEKGYELMKVRELVFFQLPCGKVELDRGGWVARRHLIRVLKQIGNRDIQVAAATQIALKGIGLMKQRIQHKEPA